MDAMDAADRMRDVFDEIYALTRPGHVYCGTTSAALVQRYLHEQQKEPKKQQKQPPALTNAMQEKAVQCYDPNCFRTFSAAVQPANEQQVEALLSVMTGSMFSRAVLAVRKQCLEQTRQCPGSIALNLKECVVSNSRVCYAYSICFVDATWTRQEHFLGLSPPLPLQQVQQPQAGHPQEEAGEARQTLADHLTQTLSEVFGLQPSTDLSSLQLSCQPSLSSATSRAFISSVAQLLGIELSHISFLSELESICMTTLSGLRGSLNTAARLAEYFSPFQPASEQLRLLLCHYDDEGEGSGRGRGVYPIVQHRDDLHCISDCLIGLINSRACISEYFRRVPPPPSIPSPSSENWQHWAELVAILEPIRRFAQVLSVLSSSPSCDATPTLSLTWLLADWLVCIYEQREVWDVVSITTGLKSSVKTCQLSPTINQFRMAFIEKCREAFLDASKIKASNAPLYAAYCQATLLDARTKDFQFFKSIYNAKESSGDDDDDDDDDDDGDNDDVMKDAVTESVARFNEEAVHEGTEQLRTAMKAELQAVNRRRSNMGGSNITDQEHLVEHRLFRVVDSMFVGKQNYAALIASAVNSGSLPPSASAVATTLGKRKHSAAEEASILTEEIKEVALAEKLNNYAELELRQYLKLAAASCHPDEVLAVPSTPPIIADPLSHWRAQDIQFPITGHFARKFLAMQVIPFNNNRIREICRRIYDKPYWQHGASEQVNGGASSCTGLLDCVIWLSVQHSTTTFTSPRQS